MSADLAITIAPADPARDAALVQGWLAHPNSAFWGMGDLDVAQVAAYLREVVAHPDQDSWIGTVDGAPAFLIETYDPARVLLVGLHDAEPGDLGMHILIASPTPGAPVRHGFTDAVFAEVVRWCFAERDAERVVVEPDVRNARILAKNAAAGFRPVGEIDVPEGEHVKRALLSVASRADFAASRLGASVGFATEVAR
ncbi:GNAT family N-acetyltransferase [Schumannella luteola]|uniref:Lysine N-acyltransferase MbtK n=1 Tax=Schumannella luteola TaxID=472059 RepID=A0A852YAE3_9MICO|nr:GNAT family N-acetyltransferase [Schumannella luteola]NYG98330.1 RimJ/RimL family protein N-acetyltransferase [Schumannella luteola]TPX05757.1 acetyltransferase [Schumannella luteola]